MPANVAAGYRLRSPCATGRQSDERQGQQSTRFNSSTEQRPDPRINILALRGHLRRDLPLLVIMQRLADLKPDNPNDGLGATFQRWSVHKRETDHE